MSFLPLSPSRLASDTPEPHFHSRRALLLSLIPALSFCRRSRSRRRLIYQRSLYPVIAFIVALFPGPLIFLALSFSSGVLFIRRSHSRPALSFSFGALIFPNFISLWQSHCTDPFRLRHSLSAIGALIIASDYTTDYLSRCRHSL